jgi:hypothetical protein
VLLLILTSCGRVSFDPPSDAASASDAIVDSGAGSDTSAVGHDEDGDGLDDAADPCPHHPALTPDTDSDGVGDLCDPEPTVGRQAIVKLVTMTATSLPGATQGTWVEAGDEMLFDGAGYASVTISTAFTNGRVIAGLDLQEQVGTPFQHQVAFGGGMSASGTSYFGEISQPMGQPAVAQLSLVEANVFSVLSTSTIGAGIPLGPATLTIDYSMEATPSVAIVATVGDTNYPHAVSAPLYSGIDYFTIGSNDVRLALRYVLVISTN